MSTGLPRPALMAAMIRDFSREAPGLSRNSVSTIKAAAAAQRCLEERIFTTPSIEIRGASSHKLERTSPARLIKEMQDYLSQKNNPVAPVGLQILIIGSLERPVNEHRPANDVFLGNEAPVAAVEAHTAVVAHGEIVVRRDNDVVALNVAGQIHSPVRPYIRIIWWRRDGWEIISVRIKCIPVMEDIGLIERLAVAIHH